jgi:hypothetical protein
MAVFTLKICIRIKLEITNSTDILNWSPLRSISFKPLLFIWDLQNVITFRIANLALHTNVGFHIFDIYFILFSAIASFADFSLWNHSINYPYISVDYQSCRGIEQNLMLYIYFSLWGNPGMWAEKYAYVNQVLLNTYATFIVYTKIWVVNLVIP